MKRLALAGMVMIAFAMLALGCGKSEKTVYKGPGGKMTVKTDKSSKGEEQTVNVETKEGSMSFKGGVEKSITEAELGAPVYPGAQVQMASKYEGKKPGEGTAENHVLTTADDFDKVAEFYKTHLKNVSGQQNISQGDSKVAMFTVGKDKMEMMVQVMWDAKKKQTMIQVIKQGN
jgi:hypothetical protein